MRHGNFRVLVAIMAVLFCTMSGCATVQLRADGSVSGDDLLPSQAAVLIEAQRRRDVAERVLDINRIAVEAGQPTTFRGAGVSTTTGYQYPFYGSNIGYLGGYPVGYTPDDAALAFGLMGGLQARVGVLEGDLDRAYGAVGVIVRGRR